MRGGGDREWPSYNCFPPNYFFLKRIISQIVYKVCARINYKIVPATNLNKYLHYGASGTE
jgi:hypothetical protein